MPAVEVEVEMELKVETAAAAAAASAASEPTDCNFEAEGSRLSMRLMLFSVSRRKSARGVALARPLLFS